MNTCLTEAPLIKITVMSFKSFVGGSTNVVNKVFALQAFANLVIVNHIPCALQTFTLKDIFFGVVVVSFTRGNVLVTFFLRVWCIQLSFFPVINDWWL